MATGIVTENPYVARKEQMFPRLTPAQMARVSSIGKLRDVKAGEGLFDVGDQNLCFFVVVSGKLEISLPRADHDDQQITVHEHGQFSGEINMISARRSLVRARMITDGQVITMDRDELRGLVQRDAEL